jgi:hypothetical protein
MASLLCAHRVVSKSARLCTDMSMSNLFTKKKEHFTGDNQPHMLNQPRMHDRTFGRGEGYAQKCTLIILPG